jgi:RNA polymerase sigma factor (sigma-70 family)
MADNINNKQEDIQLIKKVKNGDESAFEKIIKKYKKPLQFTIYNIVKNEEVAEDLALETFMKVFINIQNYKEDYSFSTWLFTIATNLSIDYTRRKKHIRFKTQNNDADENISGIYIETIENKTVESPETYLIKENQRKILLKLIDKLKPAYKKIIELRFFEEKSYKEIADEMGITVSMVKTNLHRAKKQLKKIFNEFNTKF